MKTKHILPAILTASLLSTGVKANFNSADMTVGGPSPQVRLVDTIETKHFSYDGFNQATQSWYFGENTFTGKSSVSPAATVLSTQNSSRFVPEVRFSNAHAILDVGYLNGGLHVKLKAWTHNLGVDWYLTHVTNAQPSAKPYSITEIEATRMVDRHTGILGRATWENFSGKPKLEIGAKYIF